MPEPVFLAANNGGVGGGEQMLLRTAAAARDLGREVTVVAPASPGGVVAAAREAGLAAVAVRGGSRRAYLRELRRWDRGRAGLLWCHGLVPALATAGHGRRIVHLHQQPQSRAQWVALTVARRGAIRILTPSHTMSGDIRGAAGMPNWTDDASTAPRPEGSDTLRIGFLGRLSTDKGLDVLAHAVHLASRRFARPVRLLIAGDTRWVRDDQRVRAADAVAALGDSVVRLGHVPPAELFARVDVLAFPSRWNEPFGLVVAEAMAAGVPFVVSDAGALPEVAGPAHPWVTPVGDVVALADMIERIARSDAADIANVTRAARARWETEFSPAAGRDRVRRVLLEVGGR